MLLTAEYVLPITSKPIPNGAVLVRGGKIRDVGTADMLKLRYPEESVSNYGHAVLLPGFVNAHTHMEGTVLRGLVKDMPYSQWFMNVHKLNDRLALSDFYDSAVAGCLEAISGGITTIADFSETGAVVDAVQDLGMRAVVHREVAAMDKRRADSAMKIAIDDIESWYSKVENSRVYMGIAPAPLYACHPIIYSRCAEYAGDSLRVAMHLSGSREEYNFVRYGSSPFSVHEMDDRRGFVEVPPWLPTGVTPVNYVLNWGGFEAEKTMAVHLVHVNSQDLAQLKRYDVAAVFSPRAAAKLGMGIPPMNEFVKQGFRVGLGTDSPSATDYIDMLDETRVGMLIQRSVNTSTFVPAEDMLEMATLGGARALRLDHLIGSLEIGKYADIIALDISSPRQMHVDDVVSAVLNNSTSNDVIMNMVCGRVLFDRDGFHVNADIRKSLENLLDSRRKLRA